MVTKRSKKETNKNSGPFLNMRNMLSLGENRCVSPTFSETQITDYQVWCVLHGRPEQMSHRHNHKERHQTRQTIV